MNRYKNYLLSIKSWPVEVIQEIDNTTNKILEFLGNPKSSEPFDKRGLVLGYVQSGKTANFTGLINKAYDLGYKLVIVLSECTTIYEVKRKLDWKKKLLDLFWMNMEILEGSTDLFK